MTKSYPPIHLGAPGEEISIKDLRTIKLRFKKLHQIRMQCIYDFLQPRQQIFLDFLPLIFHVNHPLLPGYVSSTAPSGIFGYSPSNRSLNAARKLTNNFKYSARSDSNSAIEGLYLMGSVGSIAFLKTSDMDIWLCHHNELLPYEIEELAKKAHKVENWAATLDLEVHFFLMNCKQFRQGLDVPISSESSGDTQHYLLLEEFYRTSIYIAGKSLAWWLIPPDQENNYDNYLGHLITQRFIDENHFIDFGGLNALPVEEFISATLWHIYKSLRSPFKSLMKLLLMECYASEYPNPDWLCHEIKHAIYQGNFTSVDLDPYVLIHLKVEAYLQKTGNLDRLALARQNFFLKIMDSSDDALSVQTIAYREKYLHDIAERCHWPINTVEELKLHQFWDIKKAISEHEIILRQLNHCFRVILNFAQDHVTQYYRQSHDLKLIGRKIYSFLDKKPGKIEIITTRSLVQSQEQELSIAESHDTHDPQQWHLYLKSRQKGSLMEDEPVLKCQTLIEILGWLVINGFCQSEQQLYFRSRSPNMLREDLQRILRQLELFFNRNFHWDWSLENYHSPNALVRSLVIINMNAAIPDELDNGLCLISGRSDVLSYGMEQRCLIHSIDRISISSWNEITSSHHEGIEGFFDCLVNLINQHRKPLAQSDLTIICYTPVRSKSIIQRARQIFDALVNLSSKLPSIYASRYLLQGGNVYYAFRFVDKILGFSPLKSKEQVIAELSLPQPGFCPIYFDEATLSDTPIPVIYSLNKPHTLQFFYYESKTCITVYVIDERGTLFVRKHTDSSSRQLLNQYSIFLESVLKHMGRVELIEYYEIRKQFQSSFSYHAVSAKTSESGSALKLRILGIINDNNPSCIIHCNETVFSSQDHSNRIFHAVYDHIVQLRLNHLSYPIYITDIDLPPSAFGLDSSSQLQTCHYLNLKQKLEAKFDPNPKCK